MLKSSLKFLFGCRIKSIRESLQLSQEKFSELIGIERDSVSKIENGKVFPSGERLEKIAEKLNLTYSELFAFSNDDTFQALDMAVYNEIADIKDKNAKQFLLQFIRLYKEQHKI